MALSERLTQLISQPELRARLGEQASAYARDYSWENVASRVIDLYHELLNKA
jgi:D-inositol-3-phosphate glycosyltransferase